MKIGTLAKRSGLSIHTLRYYERIGLLPHISRDVSGRRNYDESILDRIEFLGRLKMTGMTLQNMLAYAELIAQGEGTEEHRRTILVEHREKVRRHVAELEQCLLALDKKIDAYHGILLTDKKRKK